MLQRAQWPLLALLLLLLRCPHLFISLSAIDQWDEWPRPLLYLQPAAPSHSPTKIEPKARALYIDLRGLWRLCASVCQSIDFAVYGRRARHWCRVSPSTGTLLRRNGPMAIFRGIFFFKFKLRILSVKFIHSLVETSQPLTYYTN